MAEDPEQGGMLFDLRGRRKRVIQVIYVMLAFVMAASLLVIGLPGGLNPFSSGNSVVSQDTADLAVERATTIERKLRQDPENLTLQQELIRERIVAGNALVEVDGESQVVGPDAIEQYELAATAWERYVKDSGQDPDRGVAQLASGMLFSLAQGATVAQFEANMQAAADAQAFVARAGEREFQSGEGPAPTGLLVTLATYQLYALDFGEAARSRQEALALADSPEQKQEINRTLDAVERDAKRVEKYLARVKKQARKEGGASLKEPVGGIGGSTLSPTSP
ncbi:MAG: hypothetical protein FGM38_01985 [Solirubrobacterales bacterium]|nr:hypothetical protein [Solirubrobacterales bacterium]